MSALNAPFSVAVSYLTMDHCGILSEFARRNRSAFHFFLRRGALVLPLNSLAQHLEQYVIESSAAVDSLLDDLLAILTAQRAFARVLPTMSDPASFAHLSFTLTDRDVLVLIRFFGRSIPAIHGGTILEQWAIDTLDARFDPNSKLSPQPKRRCDTDSSPRHHCCRSSAAHLCDSAQFPGDDNSPHSIGDTGSIA
jgi:hypothetical protein